MPVLPKFHERFLRQLLCVGDVKYQPGNDCFYWQFPSLHEHTEGGLVSALSAQHERLIVSTGNLAAFADNVDYDIQTVGSVRQAFFGGEGIFMTRLTGPGTVLLQSLKRTATAAPSAG